MAQIFFNKGYFTYQITKKSPWFVTVNNQRHDQRIQTTIGISPMLHAKSRLFFMGSCFGEEMHTRVQSLGISSHSNPFGVIFHPLPMLQNTQMLWAAQDSNTWANHIQSEAFYLHNGIYHSLQHAYRFHHESPEILGAELYREAQIGLSAIQNSDLICITLGTAWIYHHFPSNTWVGNCHKLPQQDFNKHLSKQAYIKSTITQISTILHTINPSATVVFTISPVKHMRDGLNQNLASKSTLISAMTEFMEEQTNSNHTKDLYFPAYEIITEELNDWKFFRSDRMHPTDEAINVVFERFYNSFFSTKDSTLGDTV
ncbi:MAG: hypothetical protein RL747_249 [Bacteroidota bacterium]